MDPLRKRFAFGDEELAALEQRFSCDPDAALTAQDLADPEAVDVLLMGWGAADLSSDDLDALVRLKAVVHFGGGTEGQRLASLRGVRTANAKEVNALPVAEFTLAMIALAAKDAFWAAHRYRTEQRFFDRELEFGDTGLGARPVGIVGASTTGELVIRGLRARGANSSVFDPTLSAQRAASLGVTVETDLVRLAARSRILSLHAPDIPATRGMVSAEVLAALPDGATVINTARGGLVDQDALVAELRTQRLRAILDVTEPEPLPAGHPLYSLPNVLLTPHLAGAMGTEIRDLGRAAVAELIRITNDLLEN